MDPATLRDAFQETFLRVQARPALTFLRGTRAETRLSYGDLDADLGRMSHFLADRGIEKGDRVILFFPKSVLSVVVHLALLRLGAIAVPLNTGFKKSEMAYFIADAGPSLILAGAREAPLMTDLATDVDLLVLDTENPYEAQDFFRKAPETLPLTALAPEDPALIIYTSGTTGRPKGAVLTQGNLLHDARTILGIWEITEADTLCHALPLFHVHGLCFALHTALLAGARVLLLDAFAPGPVIEVLEKGDGRGTPTVFMAVPSMYARLMDAMEAQRPDLGHMRLWTSGSAPLLPKDFQRIASLVGQEPVEREGMSETGMNFSNPLHGARKPGSIGLPLPGLGVRVVHPETFEDLPQGQTGELWLRGPAITPGYWRKPEETAKTFVEGWFRTGDLGRRDEEGYYYLTDRLKHIIISGGENISPKEVEAVINRLEGVRESAVVGIPDETWGEKVVAAVVRTSEGAPLPQQVLSFCREHLHAWKCPKEVRFVEALPRNTMGKVLKEEVVRLFLQ